MAQLCGCSVFVRNATRIVSKERVLVFGNIAPVGILFNRKSSGGNKGESNGNGDSFLGIPLGELRTIHSFQAPDYTTEFKHQCAGIRKFIENVEPKDREELLIYTLATARLKNEDLLFSKEVLITAEILKLKLSGAALWKKKKFSKATILSEDERIRLESFFDIRNDIASEVAPSAEYSFDDTDDDKKVPEKYSWYYGKVEEIITFFKNEKQ